MDNRTVTLASNFLGIDDEDEVTRWSKVDGAFIKVKRPAVVREYNRSMGGVDKTDFLISLYRTSIRSRKWTLRSWRTFTIVSGLTDGVPEEIERRLAGMSLAAPAKWLAAALQAEDCPERCFPRLSKQQLVQREPHPTRRWTAGSTRTPRSECRRSASAGLPNQFHWHNECPRREMVSALADDQGNERGRPKAALIPIKRHR
ncbi:hypothetical protein HPB52_003766 [Rhipicephalus sanguineus]|uniref:PiggyBac transposable element-derived protein domain-containing protein n=1 Tax=Rhipicephalus sanguineus TaxID=34632 RepID=A0A9D4STM3_RHISA|nr:hypothetical protein HPB52_003766 [Rhipicephalus sanguineus]